MAEPPESSLATVTSRSTLLKSPTKSTRMSKGSAIFLTRKLLFKLCWARSFPKGSDILRGLKCLIMGLEFNGKYKFFALQNCGHVVSAKALKEVKSSACLVCHKEFVESDKVVINGSEAEVAALREMMKEEKAKTVKGKKNEGWMFWMGRRSCDAAQAHATKEVYALILTSSKKSDLRKLLRADHSHSVETDDRLTTLNLGFGPQTWRKRGMGVGHREKGFKGLNNGGMKKFRAADMKKSDFKGTLTCRSLRWVETDGMIGLLSLEAIDFSKSAIRCSNLFLTFEHLSEAQKVKQGHVKCIELSLQELAFLQSQTGKSI
ncbi:hypothetical protein GOBAR_AA23172 [Gossypium barbadense]|uniref:Uncharacterized protein n=1 Tax=Gossypium barbadense TaxID=3634 RepID=A0A2P5X2D4_GOSBA|nr:hypothetical protein GOBAR_AA23172 [Gossypium barbadense]